MKIEIYGNNCDKCTRLFEIVMDVVRELDLDADVVKVTEIMDIVSAGVARTPALGIDGMVRVTGRVPSRDEITSLLQVP